MKNHISLSTRSLLALVALTAPACQDEATSAAQASPQEQAAETLLFVQTAPGMSYDDGTGKLTLEGVSPAVTFFTDRPYRIAGHTGLDTFLQVWEEGSDSFKVDPPNADISIIEDGQTHSAVLELSDPVLEGVNLTYTAEILDGSLPASGGVSSLFIDGLIVRGAARGAAGGAIIGGICGDAGKGAAVGAVAGGLRGARRRRQVVAIGAVNAANTETAAQAAQVAEQTTRVVDVPNSNGSFTPVTLRLVDGGWQGPKGEVYKTLPTPDQLKKLYGI